MLAICGTGCASYNLGNEPDIIVKRVIVRRAAMGSFGMEAGLNEGLLPSSL